jgi:ribosomal protein S18 acetylase RimI-like enzyme
MYRSDRSAIAGSASPALQREGEEGRGEGRWRYRDELHATDPVVIRELAAATGFFSVEEVALAGELVEARLAQGLASGYRFILAERDGRLDGYVCFGPIPLTAAGFDLYWIAVRPAAQRTGLGRHLMAQAEAVIAGLGGRAVYVDTSTRPQYAPTRAFYRRLGYQEAASFPDFYAPGDGKLVLVKRFG